MYKVVMFCFFVCSSLQSTYLIQVVLQQQRVFVFQDTILIKSMPCSTGMHPGLTPLGSFITHKNIECDGWFEADGTYIMLWYITSFNEHISFHSLLEGDHEFVKQGIELFAQRKPSSMGCVRLQKEDALWIYDLPLGIIVEVIDS